MAVVPSSLDHPINLGWISNHVVAADGMLHNDEAATSELTPDTTHVDYFDFTYPKGVQTVTVSINVPGAQGNEYKVLTITPLKGFAGKNDQLQIGDADGQYKGALDGTNAKPTYTTVTWTVATADPGRAEFSVSGLDYSNGAYVYEPYVVKVTVGREAYLNPTKPAAPPSPPKLSAASDTGPSATDGITRNTTPTVTGTATPGATVKLYDFSSKYVGFGIASSNGSYAITSSALSDGKHSLTTKVTDASGATSKASKPQTITVDTLAPATPATPTLATASDTGSSSKDGITRDATPTLTGKTEAGATVKLYDSAAPSAPIATVVASASGTYSITPAALADGTHVLTVTATDKAGNVSAASAKTIVIDTRAPQAPAAPTLTAASDTGAPDHVTADTTPTFAGTTEAHATVTLYDGRKKVGSTVADASGGYTVTAFRLATGTHNLTVTATDFAGNVSAASGANVVTIDPKAAAAATMGGLHSMVQAMAVMGAPSSATLTPTASATPEAHPLAIAH